MDPHPCARRDRRPGVPMPKVLFVDDQWGYGPVTMALAIAEELEGRVTRLFAGQGPSFDLARRGCFDRLVQTDTMAGRATQQLDDALSTCQAVVAVMNERVAHRAVQRGVRCVYVDSLLWMWAIAPDVPPEVPYYQENFPGTAERLAAWRHLFHEPQVVGPLVARPTRVPSDDPEVALLNFGGLSCSALEECTLTTYAASMAQCALLALAHWPGRVVVAVGRHILDRLDQDALRRIRSDVELVDLSHDAYLGELRRSRVLISSAGMHALFEACAWEVPCICLPSQNLSQALALQVLACEGIVQPLDWSHLYGLRDLDARDEAGACRRIADMIHRFEHDVTARDALANHLARSLDDRHLAGQRRRQREFFRAMGDRGAPRVAARVLDLLQQPARSAS
jgi:hypothetical protein